MKDLKTILTSCGDLFPIPFVIADFTNKDQPLIFISDSFVELTGYQRDEVLGKNCRFLQGEKTDKTTINNIRKSLDNSECCYYDILNHKKNHIIKSKDNNGDLYKIETVEGKLKVIPI